MNLNYQISVSFQYGKESIEVRLPQSSIIAFPQVKEIVKIKNEISCLQKALRNPFGPSLKGLAEPKKNAVIVIPDRTRPLPIAKLLPVILDELNAGGEE